MVFPIILDTDVLLVLTVESEISHVVVSDVSFVALIALVVWDSWSVVVMV